MFFSYPMQATEACMGHPELLRNCLVPKVHRGRPAAGAPLQELTHVNAQLRRANVGHHHSLDGCRWGKVTAAEPQGLKPRPCSTQHGTTKVVPFQSAAVTARPKPCPD